MAQPRFHVSRTRTRTSTSTVVLRCNACVLAMNGTGTVARAGAGVSETANLHRSREPRRCRHLRGGPCVYVMEYSINCGRQSLEAFSISVGSLWRRQAPKLAAVTRPDIEYRAVNSIRYLARLLFRVSVVCNSRRPACNPLDAVPTNTRAAEESGGGGSACDHTLGGVLLEEESMGKWARSSSSMIRGISRCSVLV